jgi:hypothetical protein
MTNDLRHMCRNPRCCKKLAEPVANEHLAFCTPGCFSSFYLKRCRVCEEPIHLAERRRGPKRILCRKNDCRLEYRRRPDLYSGPARTAERISSEEPILPEKSVTRGLRGYSPTASGKISSEVPEKWAFKSGAKSERAWCWEEVAGLDGERQWLEHWLVDGEGLVKARLIRAGEGLYTIRLSPGIDHGMAALDEAKRQAMSLSLARLPLEPGLAVRLAKINELPPDPPQHLLPHTATYLASLAAVAAGTEAPSIVPDDMGVAADADLEMPSFLVRGTLTQ